MVVHHIHNPLRPDKVYEVKHPENHLFIDPAELAKDPDILAERVLKSKFFPLMIGNMIQVEVFKKGECHLDKQGNSTGLLIPDGTKEGELFRAAVGRIILMGEYAFNDPKRWLSFGQAATAEWHFKPKIGDWIVFNKGLGKLQKFNGIDTYLFNDAHVLYISRDPAAEGQHEYLF